MRDEQEVHGCEQLGVPVRVAAGVAVEFFDRAAELFRDIGQGDALALLPCRVRRSVRVQRDFVVHDVVAAVSEGAARSNVCTFARCRTGKGRSCQSSQ